MAHQTISQMRVLARDMGVTLHELYRRRAARNPAQAFADSEAKVVLRPAVHCDRRIGRWFPVYGTVR